MVANQTLCLDICLCFHDSATKVPAPSANASVPAQVADAVTAILNATVPEAVLASVLPEVSSALGVPQNSTAAPNTSAPAEPVVSEPTADATSTTLLEAVVAQAADLITTSGEAAVAEATIEANSTTALFRYSTQSQGMSTAATMAVLVVLFFALTLSALYVSQVGGKKEEEETQYLHDYLLIKA